MTPFCAVLLLIGGGPSQAAQGEPERIPLSVLYLGTSAESSTSKRSPEESGPRFESFERFLDEHFLEAAALDRDDFLPGDEEGYDVVLLDWGQQDIDIMKMDEVESPLGAREEWTTPTVLLGSAGLLIAGPWELPGSWG